MTSISERIRRYWTRREADETDVALLSHIPKLRRVVIELQSGLLAARHHDVFGPGLRALGWPIVSIAAGSHMSFGARLRLISDPMYSEVGFGHPCMLRTISHSAILEGGDDIGMSGATIVAAQRVRIGSRVLLGANSVVTDTDFHALDPRLRRSGPGGARTAPVIIEDDVFIGMNAVILKGVRVGEGAVIAAGAVVTRDVPANATAAGVPASVV